MTSSLPIGAHSRWQSEFLQEIANKFGASLELVTQLYGRERSELATHARITDYLDTLALQRTRIKLRSEKGPLGARRPLSGNPRLLGVAADSPVFSDRPSWLQNGRQEIFCEPIESR